MLDAREVPAGACEHHRRGALRVDVVVIRHDAAIEKPLHHLQATVAARQSQRLPAAIVGKWVGTVLKQAFGGLSAIDDREGRQAIVVLEVWIGARIQEPPHDLDEAMA